MLLVSIGAGAPGGVIYGSEKVRWSHWSKKHYLTVCLCFPAIWFIADRYNLVPAFFIAGVATALVAIIFAVIIGVGKITGTL